MNHVKGNSINSNLLIEGKVQSQHYLKFIAVDMMEKCDVNRLLCRKCLFCIKLSLNYGNQK